MKIRIIVLLSVLVLGLSACGEQAGPSGTAETITLPAEDASEKAPGSSSAPGEASSSSESEQESSTEPEIIIPETEAEPVRAEEQLEPRFEAEELSLDSKAYCAMTEDGEILLQKNALRALKPASITKVMTALVAAEYTENYDLRVLVTEKAVTEGIDIMSSGVNPSLKPGETLSVRELLMALILPSTNAAANVLADYVAGGTAEFVNLMNEKAIAIGCTNTHFMNPHGLDTEGHFTCPYDMCLILREACSIPELREILGTGVFTIPATEYAPERRFYATHQMISQSMMVNGVFAGKPGNTYGAHSTLVTAVKRGENTVYFCTMDEDEGFVYVDNLNLINETFDKLNGKETVLKPFVYDAKVTGEDEKGIYLRWRTGNGAVKARLVYYRLIKGTESAVFVDLGEAKPDMSAFLPIEDKGIYVLQLFATNAEGVEEGLGAKFLYSGELKPEGVFRFEDQQYLNDGRGLLKSGAAPMKDAVYYTNDRGALQYGFVGGRFYADENGVLQRGWIDYSGARYYLQADGRVATGDYIIDGTHFSFSDEGILLGVVEESTPEPEESTAEGGEDAPGPPPETEESPEPAILPTVPKEYE